MKRTIARYMVAIMLLLGVVAPAPLYAYNPLDDACSGAGSDSATCKTAAPTKNPLTGKNGTIMRVANIMALFGGVAAMFILVINGIRYATSTGDAQTVSQAKKGIIAALVGLVVIALARVLVALVVKGVS